MLGSAPESEVQEERIIMDVDGADLPFPDNSVDVGKLSQFFGNRSSIKKFSKQMVNGIF